MKCIAAISGGVDSVVLLHMLTQDKSDVIVAHVDHGIRDDSADDARFVQQLARDYGFAYEEKQLNLGPEASEDQARRARYDFLYALAKQYDATILTAHHGDDLAETIAINLHRGTGWRGLAVLAREGIERPLLSYSKNDVYEYAIKHRLEWVEDKTNRDKRYLRNRIRAQLTRSITSAGRKSLQRLRDRQVELARAIATEEDVILSQNNGPRHLFTQIDQSVALDLLGAAILRGGGVRPTRPQLERALIAIKTAKPGTVYHVGGRTCLRFKARFFSVEVL